MNYVFFFPDEMRANSVSCYGNRHVKMPNYDRLARQGVLFENCIVQNPVCSPSRCCLFQGQYVHNKGHRTLWHLLRKEEPNMFRYLKDSGYGIAWYGKNDLFSQDCLEEICTDIDQKRNGYDTLPSHKTGMVCKGNNPHQPEDPEFYSFLYDPIHTEMNELLWDENVARGIDFIKSRKKTDKPFFLYLPLTMPHPPYNALEQYYNMYDPNEVGEDMIWPEDTKNKPEFMELIRRYRRLDDMDRSVLKKIYAVYLGMNSYVDQMLGGILDALEEQDMMDDTMIIVSSDHGDWAGNYGLVEKWPNAMDDNIVRVPLIVKAPGNCSGHVVSEQVELFDIMPTVLETAGIEPMHTHFGKSLLPQLQGEKGDPERTVFCEGGYDTFEPHCSEAYEGELHAKRNIAMRSPENIYYPKILQQKEHPESVCRTVMIRTLKYKYVQRTSGDNELYDLINDPQELHNCYGEKEYAAIQQELKEQLLMWYLKTSDTVPYVDDPRGFRRQLENG